jgi:hypothetical protein
VARYLENFYSEGVASIDWSAEGREASYISPRGRLAEERLVKAIEWSDGWADTFGMLKGNRSIGAPVVSMCLRLIELFDLEYTRQSRARTSITYNTLATLLTALDSGLRQGPVPVLHVVERSPLNATTTREAVRRLIQDKALAVRTNRKDRRRQLLHLEPYMETLLTDLISPAISAWVVNASKHPHTPPKPLGGLLAVA